MTVNIEFQARKLAEREQAAEQAAQAHKQACAAAEELHQRQRRIADEVMALRTLSRERSLTDAELGKLALLGMDGDDLAPMVEQADAEAWSAASALQAAQSAVSAARQELDLAVSTAAMAQAREEVVAVEKQLLTLLQRMWEAQQRIDRRATFSTLWHPSDQLRRCVSYAQPPTGMSG
jgi:outer membrane usher protein FimD/PapC